MNIKRVLPVVFLAVMPMLGMAADYYIDCLLGHDSYAGTSARPKKTIQAAINIYESIVFDTEGGWESISVHPDGDVAWEAVSSDPTWITITAGGSGTGDGEVLYTISDYIGDGGSRTGTITIGDKVEADGVLKDRKDGQTGWMSGSASPTPSAKA